MTQLFIPVDPERLTGPENLELREHIVRLTQDGPVQEWVERIAEIAYRISDVRMAEICWQGSPMMVARALIEYFQRRQSSALVKVIQEMLMG